MLEKGQIKMHNDIGLEEKLFGTFNRLTKYAIRAALIVAVIIGSAILCTTSALTGEGVAAVTITLRAIGLIGFFVGLFFAQRLYRNMLKDK